MAPAAEVPLSRVALGLRSSVWAALMMQRGFIPIHAACLDSPQGTVLLLGPVGIGKSTLATALQYQGFQMLSDEMSVLRLVGNAVEVVPSCPELRLWAESLDAFGIPESSWGAPIRPPLLKFSVPVSAWCAEPRRPRALFLLSQQRHPEIELQPLAPLATLAKLHHFLYRSRFIAEMPALADTLRRTLTALAQGVAGFSLTFPSDLELLPELSELIVERLAELPEIPPPHWFRSLAFPRFQMVPERPAPSSGDELRGLALLASYPKSGNTWMRALLTAWRVSTPERDPDLETLDGGHPLLLRHHMDEVLGVDTDYLFPGEILHRRSHMHRLQAPLLATPTLIKTHDLCTRDHEGELLFPPETVAGILYVVRCPLDVVLSAMNHFQLSMEDTAEMMARENAWGELRRGSISDVLPQQMGSWSGHVNSWLNETSYRLLVVRYEDLLADTLAELKKIIEFFQVPWDEERGRGAVESTRFQRLQEQEKKKGFREKPIAAPSFFRQGQAGGWRESLSIELARRIVRDHGETMRRLGYHREIDEVLASAGGP